MDPVNEHDPTMDAHLVHAVNVNNKKEVAEMRFRTKSLANARHVQESFYRREEKDLIRQLWKLHKEKERRHPELDYPQRSGHELERLSSEQIDVSRSRRGSYNVLHYPDDHHTAFPAHQQRVHDGKYSCTGHTGEIYHPTTSQIYYPATVRREMHYFDKDHGASNYYIAFSGTSSHHFNPALAVQHRQPECYPQPPVHHRRHATAGGYQPPEDVPGIVASQSSRLNAIVQPAGYGHSISEHAAHLGMHKHYHRGMPYHVNHRPSHHTHPSELTGNIRNIDSYESLTRYITLLDYQASEEGKNDKHRKGPPHHRHKHTDADKQEDKPYPGEIGNEETPGKEKNGKKVTEVVDERVSPVSKKQDEMVEPKGGTQTSEKVVCQNDKEAKTKRAKAKSIGFLGVPSATPSPSTESPTRTTLIDGGRAVHRHQPPDKTQGEARKSSSPRLRSAEKVAPSKTPGTKHPGKVTAGAGVGAAKKSNRKGLNESRDGTVNQVSHGEVLPQRSSHHHQHISRRPSSYTTVHPPQQLAQQLLPDLHAVGMHPSHHDRHHHHPRHQQAAVVTAAERKRLAVELLAREYPVLLRDAPTKFDPLDALMCSYLRLSSTNVETLEAMCKEAGIETGSHAHNQIDNVNEYVFGNEKSK